ncbi:MAG: hypothetical protein AAF191_14575 [Verrucomicrobiota bacterium]
MADSEGLESAVENVCHQLAESLGELHQNGTAMGYFDSSLVFLNQTREVVLLPRMLAQAVLDLLQEEFPSDEYFQSSDRAWSQATVSGDSLLLGAMLATLPVELPSRLGIAVRKTLSGERVGINEFLSRKALEPDPQPVPVPGSQNVEGDSSVRMDPHDLPESASGSDRSRTLLLVGIGGFFVLAMAAALLFRQKPETPADGEDGLAQVEYQITPEWFKGEGLSDAGSVEFPVEETGGGEMQGAENVDSLPEPPETNGIDLAEQDQTFPDRGVEEAAGVEVDAEMAEESPSVTQSDPPTPPPVAGADTTRAQSPAAPEPQETRNSSAETVAETDSSNTPPNPQPVARVNPSGTVPQESGRMDPAPGSETRVGSPAETASLPTRPSEVPVEELARRKAPTAPGPTYPAGRVDTPPVAPAPLQTGPSIPAQKQELPAGPGSISATPISSEEAEENLPPAAEPIRPTMGQPEPAPVLKAESFTLETIILETPKQSDAGQILAHSEMPVTRGQWSSVTGQGESGNQKKVAKRLMVATRSEATEFLQKLAESEKKAGILNPEMSYRLPYRSEIRNDELLTADERNSSTAKPFTYLLVSEGKRASGNVANESNASSAGETSSGKATPRKIPGQKDNPLWTRPK